MLRKAARDDGVSEDGLSTRRRTCLAIALLLAGVGRTVRADPLMTYPLRIRGKALRVELADSPETRRTGLMNRRQMAEDQGMLFIFDSPAPQAMWMKNTYIPLSVAFVDAQGRIVNIEDMEPHTEDAHASAGPVLYAIEMNRGWFARRGIRPGDKVEGLKALKR